MIRGQCFGSICVESVFGQKSENSSKRFFYTAWSGINIKLFYNYKIFPSKRSIELYYVLKNVKLFCGDVPEKF